jgi:hypothetical protein
VEEILIMWINVMQKQVLMVELSLVLAVVEIIQQRIAMQNKTS